MSKRPSGRIRQSKNIYIKNDENKTSNIITTINNINLEKKEEEKQLLNNIPKDFKCKKCGFTAVWSDSVSVPLSIINTCLSNEYIQHIKKCYS